MNFRSKFPVYLLLLAVVFHASFSVIYFFPVKRILEKNLTVIFEEEKELLDIFFTNKQFAGITKLHEREFIYQGEFYDIKSKTLKNDTVYLKVYRDKKETSLFGHLQNLFKTNRDGEGGKQAVALLKMFDLFDINEKDRFPVKFPDINAGKHFLKPELFITQNSSAPLSPPPDLA